MQVKVGLTAKGHTLPGVYTRHVVTTLVNVGDFCVFTRNKRGNKPFAEA